MEHSAVSDAVTGYGVTCEPGNIFPACQNHMHAALRLHSGLRAHRGISSTMHAGMADPSAALASNITNGWIDFAFTRGEVMWNDPDRLFHNHGMFKVLDVSQPDPSRPEIHRITTRAHTHARAHTQPPPLTTTSPPRHPTCTTS